MEVLHINRNYITSALHQTMVEHLDELGINSQVFAPTDDTSYSVIKPNSYVHVSECFNNLDRYFFDLKQYKIRKALEKQIDVSRFDCIHAYTLFTDGNCAMKLAKKHGIPYIVAIRNTDVNDFFRKLFFLRKRGLKIMEKAVAICFLSSTYQEEVFSKYVPVHLKEQLLEKSYIIPNGIDDFWIEHKYTSDKDIHVPLRLIYAGQINANKNIESIQKAMKILREKGISSNLTVVGKVYDKAIFDTIIGDEWTEYHEAVTKDKLINLFRTSDIFVMPSYTETFGLVYAEAISQGLPVIYTKGQGFDGQFPEGIVGYSVDASDPNDIAKKIQKVIETNELFKCNLSDYADKFQWSKICETYVSMYKSFSIMKR